MFKIIRFIILLSLLNITACEKKPTLSDLYFLDDDKVISETCYGVVKSDILRIKSELKSPSF